MEGDLDTQDILQVLECSVCLDQLDESCKVLPCQHTFHRRCLERIFETNGSIRCPECRILLGNISINDLPSNILLLRLLEGLKNSQKSLSLRSCPPFNNNRSSTSSGIGTNSHYQLPPGTRPSFRIAQEIFSSAKSNSLSHSLDSANPSIPRPRGRALCSYRGTDSWDLSFEKGNIINLRKRVDAHWYYGELNGKHGFLPAGFIQILPLQPPPSIESEAICKALYDFHANDTGDKTCLYFKKGDTIQVIRRVDSNWAQGKINDTIGIFPLNFVELNSCASELLSRDCTDSSNCLPIPSTNFNATATSDKNSVTCNESSNGSSSHFFANTSAKTICDQENVYETLNPHPLLGPSATTSSLPTYPGTKRHSLCSPSLNASVCNVTVIHQRSKSHQEQFPAKIYTSNGSSCTVESPGISVWPADSRIRQTQIQSHSHDKQPLAIFNSTRAPVVPVFYVALFDYQPSNPDELELIRGEVYGVIQKGSDGWFNGFSVRTKQSGVFPGNYLQEANGPVLNSLGNTGILKTCSSFSDPEIDCTVPPPVGPKPNQSSLTGSGGGTGSSGSGSGSVSGSGSQTPRHQATSPVSNVYARPRPVSAIGGISGHSDLSESSSHSRLSHHASSSSGTLNESTQLSPQWPQVRVAATRMQHQSSNPNFNWCDESNGDQVKLSDECRKKEKKSLMKRWTKRKSKSPPPNNSSSSGNNNNNNNMSLDNPTVDASCNNEFTCHTSVTSAHIRSGSCPSEVMSGRSRRSTGDERRINESHSSMSGQSTLPSHKYRCTVPFPSNSEVELELNVGDIVIVHKKRDDGWFKGTLVRSGKTGLFPASFVEICPNPDA